jgi:hypothetical protein
MMHLLAFTPLYDPLTAIFPGLSDYWLALVVPLVIAISLVYKCTRIEHLADLPKEAAVMSAQIIVVMLFAALILAMGYWGYVRISNPLGHS